MWARFQFKRANMSIVAAGWTAFPQALALSVGERVAELSKPATSNKKRYLKESMCRQWEAAVWYNLAL